MNVSEIMRRAGSSSGEELWGALKMRHPGALFAACMNRHLTDDMALYIARSRSVGAEALGVLASDVRFKDSYPVKLAIVKNPRTPLRIATAGLKFVKLFDIADMSRDSTINVVIRQKAEEMLLERVGVLPSGIKAAISRRASARVVEGILNRSDRRVIDVCLGSPRLTEDQLHSIVMRENVKPALVQALAEHPVWSLRYSIRFGLLRSPHTPMRCAVVFIAGMKPSDLRTLFGDNRVPAVTKPFIYREMRERGEEMEPPGDVTYELFGSEDDSLDYPFERQLSDADPATGEEGGEVLEG